MSLYHHHHRRHHHYHPHHPHHVYDASGPLQSAREDVAKRAMSSEEALVQITSALAPLNSDLKLEDHASGISSNGAQQGQSVSGKGTRTGVDLIRLGEGGGLSGEDVKKATEEVGAEWGTGR